MQLLLFSPLNSTRSEVFSVREVKVELTLTYLLVRVCCSCARERETEAEDVERAYSHLDLVSIHQLRPKQPLLFRYILLQLRLHSFLQMCKKR